MLCKAPWAYMCATQHWCNTWMAQQNMNKCIGSTCTDKFTESIGLVELEQDSASYKNF